jgi:hypothetical protein
MLARWLHVVGNVVFFIHRKSNTTSSKSIVVCEHLHWSKLDNVTKATRRAKSDRSNRAWSEKVCQASNAKKARHTTLLLYSFRMICLSPTSSFLQMTKSAVSCLKLCHLVAFPLEGHDTGSKTALPMCFHFASKSSIPGLESLAEKDNNTPWAFFWKFVKPAL